MNNWMDAIILTACCVTGLYALFRANISGYLSIMTAAGFTMALSLGLYEYLGAAWGDTSFTHGASLLLLFAMAILVYIPTRKRVFSRKRPYRPQSLTPTGRVISGFVLLLSTAMLFSMIMALLVKISAWILEADDISRSSEIFVNGVIGSAIVRRMDSLAGYPAIIIGAVITLTGMILSHGGQTEHKAPEDTSSVRWD